MQITGITPEQFIQATARVGAAKYEHNLSPEVSSIQSPKRFRARVVPYHASKAPKTSASGARKSWSGRCVKAACWHAYRDVMIALFEINPNARIATSMAVYRGLEGFNDLYPATADQNIGSMAQPAYMPDLCDCEK